MGAVSVVKVRVEVCHRPRSRRELRRREAGWGATRGELAVRSKANLFRQGEMASLLIRGEACKNTGDVEDGESKRSLDFTKWLGAECQGCRVS